MKVNRGLVVLGLLLSGLATVMASEPGKPPQSPDAIHISGIPQNAYSEKILSDIGSRWTWLVDQYYAKGQPGSVKLNFALYPSGRADHFKVVQNTALPIFGSYCRKAVMDCAPFGPWPDEMTRPDRQHLDIAMDFNVYPDNGTGVPAAGSLVASASAESTRAPGQNPARLHRATVARNMESSEENRVLIHILLILISFMVPAAGAVYFVLSPKPPSSVQRRVPPVISGVSKLTVLSRMGFSARVLCAAAAAGLFSCLLVLLAVVAVISCLPQIYESHVPVQIGVPREGLGRNLPVAEWMQIHAQELRSDLVLREVVSEEQLVARWDVAGPEEMAVQECVELLGRGTTARPIRGTRRIEVVAYSPDPDEARRIASRIAGVGCERGLIRIKDEPLEVSDNATLPTTPSNPNSWLCLGAGLVSGLMLGVMIAGLILLVNWTIRSRNATAA